MLVKELVKVNVNKLVLQHAPLVVILSVAADALMIALVIVRQLVEDVLMDVMDVLVAVQMIVIVVAGKIVQKYAPVVNQIAMPHVI